MEIASRYGSLQRTSLTLQNFHEGIDVVFWESKQATNSGILICFGPMRVSAVILVTGRKLIFLSMHHIHYFELHSYLRPAATTHSVQYFL